jgi:hypothetical protein
MASELLIPQNFRRLDGFNWRTLGLVNPGATKVV